MRPTPKPQPDFSKVIELAKLYVADIETSSNDGRAKIEYYIFEAVMDAVYRPEEVWPYINSKI